MTNEQLTAEVKALEHFLVDVWGWADLWKLGRDLHAVDNWRLRSDSPNDYTSWWRECDAKLTQHLVGCYGRAVTEIETLTSKMGPAPVRDLLLTKLRDDLLQLTDPERSFQQWLDLSEVPELVQMDETGKEYGPRAMYYAGSRELWSYVTRDLAYWIGKVAAYIDQCRTGIVDRTASEPVVNLERIRWNGTAALFGQLVHELAAAGYITPPQPSGVDNWTAAARTLHAAFDIRKTNDERVKFSTLDGALKPQGDRDILGGKAAFKIYPRK